MVKLLKTMALTMSLLLAACASQPEHSTLYDEIGGQGTIVKITDNFVKEVSFNKDIYLYFQLANINRFKEKFNEYLCAETGGPCQYTGDTMLRVHQGMYISEATFNLTVELLIKAMKDAGLTYPQQNRLLAILAKTRSEMLNQ